jgi:hypothetical protein
MKIGYVHAMAAVLLGGGTALAQAPLVVPYDEAQVKRTSASAPAPAPAVEAAPVVAPPTLPHAPEFAHEPALPAHCGDGCGCDGCMVYASADYLLWKIREGRIPSVVNNIPVGVLTVTTSDTNVDANGNTIATGLNSVVHFFPVTISANTQTVNQVDLGDHSGGRFTLGGWTDCDHLCGVEVSGFLTERRGNDFTKVQDNANQQFLVNTPFTNNVFQVQQATIVVPGGAAVTQTSRTLVQSFPVFFVRQANLDLFGSTHTQLWGGELNARSTCCYYGPIQVGGLAGFRYLQFNEDLTVSDNFLLFRPAGLPSQGGPNGDPPTGGGPSLGNPLLFATFDKARTRNDFYGGQIGADLSTCVHGLTLDLRGKVAMGGMYQSVDVTSFTFNNDPRAGGVTPGGLLFGAADNGKHQRTKICFIPELNFKVGYQFNQHLSGYVGYDALFISEVARPGELTTVTRSTTSAMVGGTPIQLNTNSPTFQFSDSRTWAQGFNFGMQVEY